MSLKVPVLDLVANGGSFLAADGSSSSFGKLLREAFGWSSDREVHPNVLEFCREYVFRHAPTMQHFSSVILLDSLMDTKMTTGETFANFLGELGVHCIVKSDGGLSPFVGGNEGEQLGNLRNGLPGWAKKMAGLGCVATKHRTVYTQEPSDALVAAATESQVQNSGTVLEYGISPCQEPEVSGGHDKLIDQHASVTGRVFDSLYSRYREAGLALEDSSLKMAFVANGQKTAHSSPEEVAEATVDTIQAHVPEEVPLIVFLSGGWEARNYYAYLSATINEGKKRGIPQVIRASASRTAFWDTFKCWSNDPARLGVAQNVAERRAKATTAATAGSYLEKDHEVAIETLLTQ